MKKHRRLKSLKRHFVATKFNRTATLEFDYVSFVGREGKWGQNKCLSRNLPHTENGTLVHRDAVKGDLSIIRREQTGGGCCLTEKNTDKHKKPLLPILPTYCDHVVQHFAKYYNVIVYVNHALAHYWDKISKLYSLMWKCTIWWTTIRWQYCHNAGTIL